MEHKPLSATGQKLYPLVTPNPKPAKSREATIAVHGVGGGVSFAYEQLRNAADIAQRHLLLRSAIERFLRRALHLAAPDPELAEDLIIDLTQSRYLKNHSIPRRVAREIDQLIKQYTNLYEVLITVHGLSTHTASTWVYQILSVAIEQAVSPRAVDAGLVDIMYAHYHQAIDRKPFADVAPADFDIALYCAVHRSLFNADIATTRTHWLMTHPSQPLHVSCSAIDTMFEHRLTNKLGRIINRFGAPARVIIDMVVSGKLTPELLDNPTQLRIQTDAHINTMYDQLLVTTAKSLWRMVAFVFLTKMIIGIGIEIPYDLITYGTLAVAPLLINLFFPPLYMLSGLTSIRRPSRENTAELVRKIERILYQTSAPLKYKLPQPLQNSRSRKLFNVLYAATFLVPLGLTVWVLSAIDFGFVHGAVFFMFFSAVSLLRFRVLQSTREYDVIERPQTLLGAVGDFFYLPFVRLGNWLSDRYQRINIVAFLLDMLIELPLKTSLRFLRQWVSFMRDKRDEL